jgi:acetyl-CoA synthetase
VHNLLKLIEKYHITSFCAPPTVYKILITADFSKYDLSSLEYATSAGEPLNEEVYNKFLALTGIKIYESYGQTETTAIVLTTPYMEPKPGSLGKPNPIYDLRFLDGDGAEVPIGTEGEMCIASKPGDIGMFMGYYGNDELTKSAWTDGVYHTGDLAVMHEDGYVTFIGRTDDIIKSAGYRIGPFEVESIVQEHPAVLECAATGVPDALRGQLVKVSIILNEGYAASEALSKEIRAFVKANSAAYKIPRIIEFVEVLPKTISGKVRRTELRAKKQ